MPKRSRLKRGSSKARSTRMTKMPVSVTAQRIDGMLKENTGIAMMDSGGASGRSWQQNQGKDFEKEATVGAVDNFDGDWYLSVSAYHYMNSYLEVTPSSEKMNKDFKTFAEQGDNKDKPWLQLMGEFAEKEVKATDGDFQGTTNTYNYDNNLSQVLQFTRFEGGDGKQYIILQVHGGADVRGGYTDPQIFELNEDGEGEFNFAMNDFTAHFGNKWFSSDDGGYHWYNENGDDVSDKVKKWKFDDKTKRVMTPSKQVVEFSGNWENR